MGCLDHVRGQRDQVHVTGQAEGRMKSEEVRKLTLSLSSNKSLPVCGLQPKARPFRVLGAAEQTQCNFVCFPISSKCCFCFSKREDNPPPPGLCSSLSLFPLSSFSTLQARGPWDPRLLYAAVDVRKATLGAETKEPRSCPGCKRRVRRKCYLVY